MLLSNPFMVDPRVYNEAMALIEAGHEVKIIVWDRKKDYEPESLIDGVKVFRFHNSKFMDLIGSDLLRNPFWWIHAFLIGKKLFESSFKFDVVHCHDLDTLLPGVLLKKMLGAKLVYDAHEIFGMMISGNVPKFVTSFAFLFEKKLIKFCNQVIIANLPTLDYFSSIYCDDITPVMNCKRILSDSYISSESDVFTVCYIGVLSKSRMFPDIVDILGKIENIRFVIAGKKENLFDEIKDKSKSYDNIDFLGTIPFSEVIPQTLKSDAIVCLFDPDMPNNQVGMPNKIFEAMVTGRPIIVTKGLNMSRFVEKHNFGIAIEYSSESLREAVLLLRDNPDLCKKYGINGLNAAKHEFNWDFQASKLQKVYENIKR